MSLEMEIWEKIEIIGAWNLRVEAMEDKHRQRRERDKSFPKLRKLRSEERKECNRKDKVKSAYQRSDIINQVEWAMDRW